MFAVGHIALGHITGKVLGKATGHNPSIPLLWTLSLLPDIDFLIPGIIHRGPTHSILLALLLCAPFLIYKPRKAAPYFVALFTHSIVGDFLTNGGVMLLWPISSEMIRHDSLFRMGGTTESYIELTLFGILILMLVASRDIQRLIIKETSSILLFIPLCTIIIPAIYKYPIRIPGTLLIAHLILLGIMALSITLFLIQALKEKL